jgi:hypothetical protein
VRAQSLSDVAVRLLVVFFVYSCVVLCDLSEYFNASLLRTLQQEKPVVIHVERALR